MNPAIRIDARGAEAEFQAVPITDAGQVLSVVEKFRARYGASDVKKYFRSSMLLSSPKCADSEAPVGKRGEVSLPHRRGPTTPSSIILIVEMSGS